MCVCVCVCACVCVLDPTVGFSKIIYLRKISRKGDSIILLWLPCVSLIKWFYVLSLVLSPSLETVSYTKGNRVSLAPSAYPPSEEADGTCERWVPLYSVSKAALDAHSPLRGGVVVGYLLSTSRTFIVQRHFGFSVHLEYDVAYIL